MWADAIVILYNVLIIAFSVALGIGLFAIVGNYIRAGQPEPRTQNRHSDDNMATTARLVQELYDEYIGKG